MNQAIKVTVRNVYGNEMVYPVCDTALKLAKLAGHKTFTHYDLCVIESLGYTIEQVAQPSSVLSSLRRSA